jgi:hypothetical protein
VRPARRSAYETTTKTLLQATKRVGTVQYVVPRFEEVSPVKTAIPWVLPLAFTTLQPL